jgi:hypothetical protein
MHVEALQKANCDVRIQHCRPGDAVVSGPRETRPERFRPARRSDALVSGLRQQSALSSAVVHTCNQKALQYWFPVPTPVPCPGMYVSKVSQEAWSARTARPAQRPCRADICGNIICRVRHIKCINTRTVWSATACVDGLTLRYGAPYHPYEYVAPSDVTFGGEVLTVGGLELTQKSGMSLGLLP